MAIISTRVHGALDYGVGGLLIAAPWLLGFATGGPAQWVPVVLGAGAIVYSLLTRYELGVIGLIPMPVHLAIDAASGVLLALSPWLFGFAGLVFLPHVLFGAFEVTAAALTDRHPRGRTV